MSILDEEHKRNPLVGLIDAMRYHGDFEGTRVQLEDAESFLWIAFLEIMTQEQQEAFMSRPEVREFMEENNPNPNSNDRCTCGHTREQHGFDTSSCCRSADCDCFEWNPA